MSSGKRIRRTSPSCSYSFGNWGIFEMIDDSESPDVVFLTIDCWRHDTPDAMESFQELTGDYLRREAICPAPTTRGVFPAILAGQYYPTVCEGFDGILDGTRPLMELLAEAGYSTGGFVASNPFLTAWKPYFDTFWNDGLADSSRFPAKFGAVSETLRNATDYARFRGRVTATELSERAEQWYATTAGPKFCWIHLMDVHVPFLPGFRRSVSSGLVKTLRSHYEFSKQHSEIDEGTLATLEILYWECVDLLDKQLESIFDFLADDAAVVVVGDHGEEFNHGKYGHARLYDECVRVPLFVSPVAAEWFSGAEQVRQLDIPATVASNLGLDVPSNWDGVPHGDEGRGCFLLNYSPMLNRAYTGIRTEERKVIKTFHAETQRHLRTEAYDLAADPDETNDVAGTVEWQGRLVAELDEFVSNEDIAENMVEDGTDLHDSTVETRLRMLGYK